MMNRLTTVATLLLALTACARGSDRAATSGTATGASSPTAGATSAASVSPVTPMDLDQWEKFDFASNPVTPETLEPLPLAELQRIRGIIFGKHGRIFEDSTLQNWLLTRPWYHPDSTFTNARLSSRERDNLDIERGAEAKKHRQIEPGDMRFYQTRAITTAMLGQHSAPDWEVLEAEVLANHGFVFESADFDDRSNRRLGSEDLQHYFDDRYWYDRNPDFAASQLSAVERQNLDTIALAIMRQNKRSISPGVMNLFQTTTLIRRMLENVNLADLRLLRNEIYARHGRPFQTQWLAEYFRQQPWYAARKDYSDAELSPVEKANIALITQREEELHQALSTQILSPSDLSGLRPDDARRLRNEIYARHGRRFKDPMLQRYFASFSWYKPNAQFSESQLNQTEKVNAERISQYEQGRFTEG